MGDAVRARERLLALARAVISGDANLIQAAREISHLRFEVGDPDNRSFFLFRTIESETDHFPTGEVRERASPAFRLKSDAEMNRYIEFRRAEAIAASRTLIQEFSEESPGR
jgi:hypothetical protein